MGRTKGQFNIIGRAKNHSEIVRRYKGTNLIWEKPSAGTYLLEGYTAKCSYSLRYIEPDFEGNDVILVRRGSDSATQGFTPDDITSGALVSWVGASDGYVVRWYDQEGSYDLQEVATNIGGKIVINGVLNTVDGLPAIYQAGDGVEGYLIAGSGIDLTTEFSMFIVNHPNPSGTDATNYAAWVRIGFTGFAAEKWSQGRNASWIEYDTSSVSFSSGHKVRITVRDSSNTGYAWTNGVSNGSASVTTETGGGFLYLGSRQASSDLGSCEQNVQEFVLMLSDESANVADLSSNMEDYWI